MLSYLYCDIGVIVMKKEEAIRNFVRSNYELLKEKETFDRKKYKEVVRVLLSKD
jgi:hypothetical protein